jgi:hypothetical protein
VETISNASFVGPHVVGEANLGGPGLKSGALVRGG